MVIDYMSSSLGSQTPKGNGGKKESTMAVLVSAFEVEHGKIVPQSTQKEGEAIVGLGGHYELSDMHHNSDLSCYQQET